MKPARSEDEQSLVIVARAVKTKGLHGELVADLLTDFPDRFEDVARLFTIAPDGERSEMMLERYSLQQGRLVLKLAGFDTIEAARTLVGCEFAVTEAERVQLPEDAFYDYELEGCMVESVAGKHLGRVAGVLRTGGASLLVVRDDSGHDILIPLAGAIVTDIDIEHKRIQIDPPEGLLEL